MLTEQEWKEFRREGVVSRGPFPARLARLQVYGERRSGTRYLSTALGGLYGLRQDRAHGWKHGPPAFPAASRFTLFLIALRDPFDWAVSLYAHPHLAAPALTELDFDAFITSPWDGVMARPKAFSLDPRGFRGQVLQADRHPITGQRYGSIFEMRSVKLRAWLGLFERDLPVALIKTEALQNDPEPVLTHLEHHFPLHRQMQDWDQPDDLFPDDGKAEARRAHAIDRLEPCRDAILARLDQDLERACGYLT